MCVFYSQTCVRLNEFIYKIVNKSFSLKTKIGFFSFFISLYLFYFLFF